MGLFGRRKQEDRSYSVKLRRTSYAKLGLLSERLKTSETDTLDGIIDFALANYGTTTQAAGANVNLASLITGEEADSDLTSELIKAFLPRLLSGGFGGQPATGAGSVPENNSPSSNPDTAKALKDLGL